VLFPYLALDASYVYYTTPDGGAKKVPRNGGSSVEVVPAQSIALGPIAADDQNLYWTTPADAGTLSATSLATGATRELASLFRPFSVALDASYVYVTEMADPQGYNGRVLMVPKTGGCPEIIATGLGGLSFVALDNTRVFWVTEGAVMVRALP
jgi:hypothetical protein